MVSVQFKSPAQCDSHIIISTKLIGISRTRQQSRRKIPLVANIHGLARIQLHAVILALGIGIDDGAAFWSNGLDDLEASHLLVLEAV